MKIPGAIHFRRSQIQDEKMSECPRVLTLEQMITMLKAGRRLCVDRRDAPELPVALEVVMLAA
jgi:hypothetical protein